MGNCCGKEDSSDPFAQPGRTLSSSAPPPNPNKTSPLPKKVGGPPRTLGSGGKASSPQTDAQQEDARRKAAEAAEARAKAANIPKGKLGRRLQEQKKQTRSDTLDAARMRDADAAAETRAYN